MEIQTLNKIGDSLRMLRGRLVAEMSMAMHQSDTETARELRDENNRIGVLLSEIATEIDYIRGGQAFAEAGVISMDVTSVTVQSHGVTMQVLGRRSTAFYKHETGTLTINV